MPSSIASTLSTTGFQPEFFQLNPSAPKPQVQASSDEGGPRISYGDGPYAEFCAGEHFARYRDQVLENVDFIVARCKQLNMHDAPHIEQDFRCFYARRFTEAYFDTDAPLIDSAGKRALDNFCAMLRDDRLPNEKQKDAIRELSRGVTVCASGVVAHLTAADRELALSVGGIRGKLWNIKEQVARQVLQQAMFERFGTSPNYHRKEIHHVHAAWNHMADAVGLNKIFDRLAPDLDQDLLASCQEKVVAAMSPDNLATVMADDCLGKFRSGTVFDSGSMSRECTSADVNRFYEVLNDICRDLGVAESALSLYSFVQLDDDGRHYHVRDDSSLIAFDLLNAMHADGLLTDAPIHPDERVDER